MLSLKYVKNYICALLEQITNDSTVSLILDTVVFLAIVVRERERERREWSHLSWKIWRAF